MVINETLAAAQIGFPLLSLMVFLPLVAAVALVALREPRLARRFAIGCALLEVLLALALLHEFVAGSADMQFAERLAWMPSLGIEYHLGVDGLSLLFVPLTALLFLALVLACAHSKAYPRLFLACLLALESATLGMYVSVDLILFFCFFELALVPSFWLIKLWGVGPQRQQAAVKYLIYMLLGSLPLLVGFILLGMNHAEQTQGAPSFDLLALLATPIDGSLQVVVLALLAVGFAVKGPAVPFHTWMPAAVMEGPAAVGVYLLGLKVGAYGIMRFALPLAPDAGREWAWLAIALGLAAVLYGALIALVQLNLRRLIVFASVSHVGLILAALFSLNEQAWQGALLLMLNAGLATAGLFMGAGFLQRRLGSTELSSLGGLARQVPRLACFCFVAGLALIGLPGTSGFAGELLAMSGAYKVHWAYGMVAVLGVILSAGYFLWFYQRAFFGPITNPAARSLRDLDGTEMAVAAVFMALLFGLGFAPKPMVDATAGSVQAMTERVRVGALPPAPAPLEPTATGAPVRTVGISGGREP